MESKKVDHEEEKSIRDPYLMKKIHKEVKTIFVDYLKQVQLTLQDKNSYNTLLNIMTDYPQHHDTNRVLEDAWPLFKDHPELYLQLQWILNDQTDRPISENRPASDRETLSLYEQKIVRCEEELFGIDTLYYTLKSAKASAERLVTQNMEKSDLEEAIDVEEYYSCLNLGYLKNLLEGKYLLSKLIQRGKAIEESIAIAYEVEKELRKVKKIRIQAEKKLEEAFVGTRGKGKARMI